MSKVKLQVLLWCFYIVFLALYAVLGLKFLSYVAMAFLVVALYQLLKTFIPVVK